MAACWVWPVLWLLVSLRLPRINPGGSDRLPRNGFRLWGANAAPFGAEAPGPSQAARPPAELVHGLLRWHPTCSPQGQCRQPPAPGTRLVVWVGPKPPRVVPSRLVATSHNLAVFASREGHASPD